MSEYEMGDIVTLQPIKYKYFYVYELIDDSGVAFYVGMTAKPRARLVEHCGQRDVRRPPNSGVKIALRSIKVPRLRIVSVHESREEAERDEAGRISRGVGLVNSANSGNTSKGKTLAWYESLGCYLPRNQSGH